MIYVGGSEEVSTSASASGVSIRRLISAMIALGTLTLLLVPATAAFSSSTGPEPGDYFEYDYNVFLDEGYGWYYGYWETMRSHSRYEVTSVDGSWVTMHRTGSWTYQASDGSYDSAIVDQKFRFDLSTRLYVDGEVDVDQASFDTNVWFWIPPWSSQGEVVKVLDDYFSVASTDSTTWCGWLPYKGIRLETSGQFTRNDVYGYFNAYYEEVYHFDKGTGFILSDVYTEYDEYGYDSFRWREEVFLTDSSYVVPYDWSQLLGVYVGIPLVIMGAVAVVHRVVYGPSRYKFKADAAKPGIGAMEVRVKRLWSPKKLLGMEWGGSSHFAPLVPVFASRALGMRDPVVAAFSEGQVVGLAIRNRESAMGTVFADDQRVANALIKRLRMKHFFLDSKEENWSVKGAVLIDAFDVLRLKGPRPQSFDADRIRPMTKENLTTVTRIAQAVYKGKAKRWIKSSFNNGDVAFIAMERGKVVGFAFATVAGRTARLHTLTILPQQRAHGLGTELMAARLNTLAALGVEEVLVEISRFNIASTRIAHGAGFSKVGESAYFSKNPELMLTEAHRRL